MRDGQNRPPSSPTPDLLLERYLLDELPPDARLRLEVRIGAEPGLRDRLDALRASNDALLREHPPEVLARGLQHRRRREDLAREGAKGVFLGLRLGFSRRMSGMAAAVAGACLLVLVAVPAWRIMQGGSVPVAEAEGTPGEADADGIRIKGLEPRLAIFRKTAHGAEPLQPGGKARPGEFLRIGYHAAGFGYGAIVSVDGNGGVTRHWPAAGNRAARLEGGEALLPTAFELDAAPDFERFYLVVSRKPFALDPLLESLRRNQGVPPPPPEHARMVRFDVLKDTGI